MDIDLKLSGIRVHKTDDGFWGGSSEWRLDFDVGGKHLDWDKNGVDSGEYFPINHTFEFKNHNPAHDLNIVAHGKEDDPVWDDVLPTADKTLQTGDLYDHSFEMYASSGDYAYTTYWSLDVA